MFNQNPKLVFSRAIAERSETAPATRAIFNIESEEKIRPCLSVQFTYLSILIQFSY